MDPDHDLRDLSWWDRPGQDMGRALTRAATHPALFDAVRALASNMLDLSARERAIDSVFKDAGRYVTTMAAVHLHQTGGLTLPRLKALCQRSGLLSSGRARALLHFLEHLGCFERHAGPGRTAIYRPTEAFMGTWRAQLRAALEAGRLLEPGLAAILDDPDPERVWTFGRLHTESLLGEVAHGQPMPAFLRVFMHRYAGSQIVLALFASMEGPEFPPRCAGPISISGLSRRFGVSRIHISRIFDEAEREGLAHLDQHGFVRFEEVAREQMRFLYGAQLAHILVAAARTARVYGLFEAAGGEGPRADIPLRPAAVGV